MEFLTYFYQSTDSIASDGHRWPEGNSVNAWCYLKATMSMDSKLLDDLELVA